MKRKMWVVSAIVAAVIYFIASTLYTAGSFRSIAPHMEGTVETVYANMPGPEDMDLDDQNRLLYISSSDRWKLFNHEHPVTDGIYVLSLDSDASAKRLPTDYKGEFHPHGISFLNTPESNFLFVVNHNESGNFVEIFRISGDMLVHQKSIADSSSLCCPNDVVAVGQDRFYVTNDHGSKKGLMRTLEDYGRIPRASLLYYNGQTLSKAWGGLNYANGVNVSRDGKEIYLTTTTGRHLLTFDRDETTGKLHLKNKLRLKTGADNIDVDHEGNLWIAAHPKLLAFVSHAKDPKKHSPSQVLKLTPDPATGGYTVKEVFLDDGSNLSGSSSAVASSGELFIGVVFENKVLRLSLDR